jgi:heme-degrading monooxygenase HmoA
MFLHMSIHRPHPQYVAALAASMNRFGAAMSTQPGFLQAHAFRTPDDRLIGVAMWESRGAFERGVAAAHAAIADEPLDLWEAGDVQIFTAESVG